MRLHCGKLKNSLFKYEYEKKTVWERKKLTSKCDLWRRISLCSRLKYDLLDKTWDSLFWTGYWNHYNSINATHMDIIWRCFSRSISLLFCFIFFDDHSDFLQFFIAFDECHLIQHISDYILRKSLISSANKCGIKLNWIEKNLHSRSKITVEHL